jgi:hypothetical protein
MIKRVLVERVVVFVLASSSFACLLGQMYGLWSMQTFACWALVPATIALAVVAALNRDGEGERPRTWICQGAMAGIVAAIFYDLYRLPFVLAGIPLFKVFLRFGQLLLNADGPMWLVQLVGWTYHFSNGAALGIMYLVVMSRTRGPVQFWGAVAWALFVEAMMLLTPYTTFFALKLDARFLLLTVSAHIVFGVTLGLVSVFLGGSRERNLVSN